MHDVPLAEYEYAVILGVVGLPTSDSARKARGVDRDPTGGFSTKSALLVRPGASVELSIPPELRGRMRIAWGIPHGKPTLDLTVPAWRPGAIATDHATPGPKAPAFASEQPPLMRWLPPSPGVPCPGACSTCSQY